MEGAVGCPPVLVLYLPLFLNAVIFKYLGISIPLLFIKITCNQFVAHFYLPTFYVSSEHAPRSPTPPLDIFPLSILPFGSRVFRVPVALRVKGA